MLGLVWRVCSCLVVSFVEKLFNVLLKIFLILSVCLLVNVLIDCWVNCWKVCKLLFMIVVGCLSIIMYWFLMFFFEVVFINGVNCWGDDLLISWLGWVSVEVVVMENVEIMYKFKNFLNMISFFKKWIKMVGLWFIIIMLSILIMILFLDEKKLFMKIIYVFMWGG